MKIRLAALFGIALAFCGCKPPEQGHVKAILGAVLLDGAGGPPVSNSVVVVAGGQIRGAGASSTIPIPADCDRIDGGGRFLVPALVDICDRQDPPGRIRAATALEAQSEVAALVASGVRVVDVASSPAGAAGSALEAAREAGLRITGHFRTQSEARFLVNQGAQNLVGMIADTEDLDPVLVASLRDLRIVVAPSLGKAGVGLEIAKRNTRRLFQAGVLLALASQGGDPLEEAGLMVEAGVPPLDVLVASTRNGAAALQLPDRGSIAAGKRADLLLLSANPAEDIHNLRQVALRLEGGEPYRPGAR